jgi:hypothetical protein
MHCQDFHNLLQQRLDGVDPLDGASLDQHLASCPECRSWLAAAMRLEEGLGLLTPPIPPLDLAERITARVVAFRRRRFRVQQAATAAALAASLLISAYMGYSWWSADRHEQDSVAAPLAQPPGEPQPALVASLDKSVEEAGSALVALAGRTVDETVGQSRILLPTQLPAPPLPTADSWQQPLEPPVRSLRDAGKGVSEGLEPVATSARQAVNLFLKELPLLPLDRKTGP